MRTKQQRVFSETDKAAWRASKQQRLADLGERLKTQVASVQDSDAFKRYLAAQAVFHRYSARNVFLILYQRPEATRVAGYTTWQKLGRQVRRGETGVTIFAPAPFKQTITDTTTGEVTEALIPRFKTATVFDIAQTVGEPLPTIKLGEIAGSVPAGAYAVLVDFAASIGYSIVPHPEDDEAEGRCNYEQQTISVQAAAPERMLHILIHELAHALTSARRQAHDRTERETIAEGVAFVTCTAIGLDAGGYAFLYIAGYAGQKDGAAIVTRLMDTIQKTAAQIIEVVETRLLGEGGDSEETEEALGMLAASTTDHALIGG
jgi:N-terminal domain of anti-restriction factor ArdC